MDRLSQAKRYSNTKYLLALIEIIFQVAFLIYFLLFGTSDWITLRLSNALPGFLLLPTYLLALLVIYSIVNLPLSYYASFALEHQFSLSKQKISDWLSDQVKSGIIFYIILLILFEVFYYLLKISPNYWWFIVSMFWIFFSLILAKLTPTILIPLFFKYKKLSDANLRERIIKLAEKMNVKILDVFEIDFSKKTLKANAAFVGWGKSRRVILADTLKDKYSYDEIEIILAHEFAHYKLKHLLKLILINSLATIISFYFIFLTSFVVLSWFGFSSLSDVAAFPIVALYFIIFGIITQPFQNYISRVMETHADQAALKITGLKEAFVSTMNKLADQNLADRSPHPVIKFFFFDHPPIDERIKIIH